MADSTPKSYHTDPTLYLYTSLTSGSSHIISATSRMQTILKANRIDFQALDVATDEKARMLWGRRAGKRKLPGLVRFGMIVGDLEEVEEWNEYGELKENVNLPGPSKAAPITPTPSATTTPSKAPPQKEQTPAPSTTSESTSAPPTQPEPEAAKAASELTSESKGASADLPSQDVPASSSANTLAMAMRQAGFEAAKKAGDAKAKARHDELERLKAKSAELQKPDESDQRDVPQTSGGTGAEEREKEGLSAGTDKTMPAEEGQNEEGIQETAIGTKGTDGENVPDLTKSAAEAEMAKSSGAASAAAAEPDVLEGVGQADKEKATAEEQKQPKKSETKSEPQHILNAKEAEEAANKAIIADESTHVHIAGSPPPFASPGIKPPKDDEDEEEDGKDSLTSRALKDDTAEHKGAESSNILASESKNQHLEKGADGVGKSQPVDTTLSTAKTETEPAERLPASSEQSDTDATDAADAPKFAESEAKPAQDTSTPIAKETPPPSDQKAESTAPSKPVAESPAADDSAAESNGKPESEQKQEAEHEQDQKQEESAPAATSKHTKDAASEHNKEPYSGEAATATAATTKEEQPAASGENAGDSVGD